MPPKLLFSLPSLSQALKAIQHRAASAGSADGDSSGDSASSSEDLAHLRKQLLLLGSAGSRLTGLQMAPGTKVAQQSATAPALAPSGPDRQLNEEQSGEIVNLLQVRMKEKP